MISTSITSQKFPKSARLRTKKDFKFGSYRRVPSEHFLFLLNRDGQGRLGLSISKKVLRRAHARNRVRRVLREVFRNYKGELGHTDIHVIGLATLTEKWFQLKRADVEKEFLQATLGKKIAREKD